MNPSPPWIAAARRTLRGELQRLLSETRTTTVFITHDPGEVQGLATRSVWLEDGRLVDDAPENRDAALPSATTFLR